MRGTPSYRRAQETGQLAVECWCRATTVGVPIGEILACLTRSCGLDYCDRLDEQHRAEQDSAR